MSRFLFVAMTLAGSLVLFGNLSGQDLEERFREEYYTSYADQLLLRIYTLVKSSSVGITREGKQLLLDPNGTLSLGGGFNYKSFGLNLGFGLPASEESNRKFGKTRRLDIQSSVYSRKFGAEAFFQAYDGYYNSNPHDFVDWNQDYFPRIPGMKVLSFGASGFYLFNYEKFSYRAAFVRNEIQNRSAGSFTAGFYFTYDDATTDLGFIPQEYSDSLKADFDLKTFNTFSSGISLGYIHSFVYKRKVFLTIGAIPGFGYKRVAVTTLSGADDGAENLPAGQLLARSALGYEHRSFFLGTSSSITVRNLDYKDYNLDLATWQVRVFVGRRFVVQKK